MEYEEIRLLKQSEKSTIYLVRERDGGGQVYVRKRLAGRHPIYQTLRDCPHPCLPRLYEVTAEEDSTTVIEEYVEGQTPDGTQMSRKQLRGLILQLCGVLEFLHKKGIIHRDIKPSNLLLTGEGRLYLIDFDAARTLKEDQAQDTQLLGTRGFAPPEQYGFAQTDERTDIYALGATLERILGGGAGVYDKKVIRRCMNLNPDKRYQSVGDGMYYTDSSFVVSDAFVYVGEDAPPLPAPTGLCWKVYEEDNTARYIAALSNLDDYEDKDSFNVTVYDQNGEYVMNNIWNKSGMVQRWHGGVPIRVEYLAAGDGQDHRYRFTMQVYSSRPNEYGPSLLPDPVPEEYYSPWLFGEPQGEK